ncbi:unnamed protein product [Aphanomyces euteiches]
MLSHPDSLSDEQSMVGATALNPQQRSLSPERVKKVPKPQTLFTPLAFIVSLILGLNLCLFFIVETSNLTATMSTSLASSRAESPLHIHWAHAVNSQDRLASALSNGQAIEADILLNPQKVPVMAHPPANDSDLTLSEFLTRVESATCIVKLDFKSYDAFRSALPLIAKFDESQKSRIWINADILKGSNAPDSAFPAAQFINEAKACGAGKLSVGWTTSANSTEYSSAMVTEMLQLLNPHDDIAATFPIKASLVRGNWGALKNLYSNPSFGMTLWLNEPLSDDDLEWLYHTLETSDESLRGRTYYDLQGWNNLVQRKGW